jgi:hypothetical protein
VRSAVITMVAGRHRHLDLQRRGLLAGVLHPDQYIVVSMNDPSAHDVLDTGRPQPEIIQLPWPPGQLPLARARNLGAQQALTSGADLLIFLDVDCIPGPRLVQRYAEYAGSERQSSVLCGPVSYLPPPPPGGYALASLAELGSPHPARPVPPDTGVLTGGDHRLFWSLSFAVQARLWQDLGGFCEEYQGYGGEDTDFGQLAASRRVAMTWVGGAWAYHQYHPAEDPPVQHVHDIVRNAAIFRRRWGWWPMIGWLHEFERRGLIRLEKNTQNWEVATSLPAGPRMRHSAASSGI